MPVPWETLLPFGLVIAMFTISGAGMSTVSYVAEGYKPRRYNTDIWDHRTIRCAEGAEGVRIEFTMEAGKTYIVIEGLRRNIIGKHNGTETWIMYTPETNEDCPW
ncbi:hypothetical protein TWF173_006379 [Orbilia oligospora]|nr:hypothetical protein TWF173_006379 [Orbilia oligospora]